MQKSRNLIFPNIALEAHGLRPKSDTDPTQNPIEKHMRFSRTEYLMVRSKPDQGNRIAETDAQTTLRQACLAQLDSVIWPTSDPPAGIVTAGRLTGLSLTHQPAHQPDAQAAHAAQADSAGAAEGGSFEVVFSVSIEGCPKDAAERCVDRALAALQTLDAVSRAKGYLEGRPLTPTGGAAQSPDGGNAPGAPSIPVHHASGAAPDRKAHPGENPANQPQTGNRPPQPKAEKNQGLEQVARIYAIGSGKGGVGKSTLAANLALALRDQGLTIGLLDADFYGPSQHAMFGGERPEHADDAGHVIPPFQSGIKVMSMGFLVERDRPVIWRGPMLQSALRQLLFEVAWGKLDVLLIDLPPGTGDIGLSLAQMVPLSGAVVISTPQDIALLDAIKAVEMFRKLDVPILGIVENMALFVCPHCGGHTTIFGEGGVAREAERLGLAQLGSVPLALSIRKQADLGLPVVEAAPESPEAQAFRDIATNLVAAAKAAEATKTTD